MLWAVPGRRQRVGRQNEGPLACGGTLEGHGVLCLIAKTSLGLAGKI